MVSWHSWITLILALRQLGAGLLRVMDGLLNHQRLAEDVVRALKDTIRAAPVVHGAK